MHIKSMINYVCQRFIQALVGMQDLIHVFIIFPTILLVFNGSAYCIVHSFAQQGSQIGAGSKENQTIFELSHEKICLEDFPAGPTQTGLYSH